MTTPEVQIQTHGGSDLLDAIASVGRNYDATVKHATSFQLQLETDNTITFHGSGFSYLHGQPTAGYVTSITIQLAGANYARIDNLSFGLVKLFNIITGDHPEKLFDVFGDTGFTGNTGSDFLIGGSGSDRFDGRGGDDVLAGRAGADDMVGGKGSDTASYFNAKGVGVIASLTAPDINSNDAAGDAYISIENLNGSKYRDVLIGDSENNSIAGGGGPDVLYGVGGQDTLSGSSGADELYGGKGSDRLYGGAGNDQFSYIRSDISTQIEPDRIYDWNNGDVIAVDGETFHHGLVPGQELTKAQFHIDEAVGHKAQFVYISGTGSLFWDVDGDGSGSGIIVATLQGAPAIDRHDIVVFSGAG